MTPDAQTGAEILDLDALERTLRKAATETDEAGWTSALQDGFALLVAEVRRLRTQLDTATRMEWGVRCGSASTIAAQDERDARLHLLFAEQECGWCGGSEHTLVQREIRLAMPAGPWSPVQPEEATQ